MLKKKKRTVRVVSLFIIDIRLSLEATNSFSGTAARSYRAQVNRKDIFDMTAKRTENNIEFGRFGKNVGDHCGRRIIFAALAHI